MLIRTYQFSIYFSSSLILKSAEFFFSESLVVNTYIEHFVSPFALLFPCSFGRDKYPILNTICYKSGFVNNL